MDEQAPDQRPSRWQGLVAASKAGARAQAERASSWLDALRGRFEVVETGAQVYERDRDAAGTLLGSALALRFFLFFVPQVLFVMGLAGVLGSLSGVERISSTVGLTGSLAGEIDDAFNQGAVTPWVAMAVGLFGMATAGRSLTRALVVSSALSWRLGGKQKTPVRVIGVVVGIVVGLALCSAILNRIRIAAGLAVASVSYVAVAAVYLALMVLLFLALPRGSTDPGAALPGAAMVAAVMAGLQAVTQLWIPARISSASSIYGSVGIALVVLGWFFIIGRAMALAFALNAVVFERVGSVSRLVFGLPLVRLIPRRWPSVARYFDLDGLGSPED